MGGAKIIVILVACVRSYQAACLLSRMVSALVSAAWLRQQMVNGLRNIRIIDGETHFVWEREREREGPTYTYPASWNMAGEGRKVFLTERLAGAQHFDIDEVADRGSSYPHMAPSPALFQDLVGKVRDHT